MKLKRTLILIFFIVAGIIIGALIASAAEQVPWLSWLAFGKSVGIDTAAPMVIDFSVLRIAFGFTLGINVAQIFCITGAILIYRAVIGKL